MNTNIYESGLIKLIESGKTRKQAKGILQSQFEKSGIFKKGTQELTTYGKSRQMMTEEERAIDRYSKGKGVPKYKLKYVNGKVLIKNIYKK